MKTNCKHLISIISFSLLMLACNKANDDLSEVYEGEAEAPVEEVVEKGSISLNTIFKDVIDVKTGKPPSLEELLDDMVVQIKKEETSDPGSGLVVVNSNYRDLPATISLIPGTYSILVSNFSFSPSRFDDPVHGAYREFFSVAAGLNTLLELEIALFDVAVTINYSSELTLTYPDISTRVEFNKGAFSINPFLDWTSTENGRTGYLNAYEGDFYFDDFIYAATGALNLEITATDAFGFPVVVNKTYPEVTANQHYVIAIEQTEEATATLTITLGDEEIIEDTITFPVN